MAPKTQFDARLAVLLANLAVFSTVGCVADESAIDESNLDETVEIANDAEAFGIGAQGAKVREVYDYLRRFGYFQNEELVEHYPNWKPAVDSDQQIPKSSMTLSKWASSFCKRRNRGRRAPRAHEALALRIS